MPHSQGNRSHQQRRIFRGRGGPTDGNLPPKKNVRPKVKYQPEDEESNNQIGHNDRVHGVDGNGDSEESDQENERQLGRDENNSSLNGDNTNGDDDNNTPLHKEIRHLQKRIQNVQLSLQTSQGLSNPKTWRTNCLFPVRNVVKEWRSILMYHVSQDLENSSDHNSIDVSRTEVPSEEDANDDCKKEEYKDILHSTSQQVFGLIQMAMQSGPLVGSNPGYFKRCGGEVASLAYEFLQEILDIAHVVVGIDNEKIDDDAECIGNGDGLRCDGGLENGDGLSCDGGLEHFALVEREAEEGRQVCETLDGNYCETVDSTEVDNDSQSESESSSSTSSTSDDENVELMANIPGDYNNNNNNSSSNTPIINLQSSLLFTEKQSQRLCQWHRNADKAKQQNKPPSKSAQKLQHQKSKKQKQKELKMQRKLKKKKKGGGK
mmetsp:Transcript_15456/g.26381  ORF Transcript_15456/g.26381 Transcript_15456/m.26381 type:complete len:433 (-) Transcript_15456:455-1753(-)